MILHEWNQTVWLALVLGLWLKHISEIDNQICFDISLKF